MAFFLVYGLGYFVPDLTPTEIVKCPNGHLYDIPQGEMFEGRRIACEDFDRFYAAVYEYRDREAEALLR